MKKVLSLTLAATILVGAQLSTVHAIGLPGVGGGSSSSSNASVDLGALKTRAGRLVTALNLAQIGFDSGRLDVLKALELNPEIIAKEEARLQALQAGNPGAPPKKEDVAALSTALGEALKAEKDWTAEKRGKITAAVQTGELKKAAAFAVVGLGLIDTAMLIKDAGSAGKSMEVINFVSSIQKIATSFTNLQKSITGYDEVMKEFKERNNVKAPTKEEIDQVAAGMKGQ